jgi:hypothetical protein
MPDPHTLLRDLERDIAALDAEEDVLRNPGVLRTLGLIPSPAIDDIADRRIELLNAQAHLLRELAGPAAPDDEPTDAP